MTLDQFIALLGNGTGFTILVVFVAAAATGRIVFQRESEKDALHTRELLKAKDDRIDDLRRQLLDQERETEYWRAATFRLAPMLSKSLDLATTATTAAGNAPTG